MYFGIYYKVIPVNSVFLVLYEEVLFSYIPRCQSKVIVQG